MKLLIGICILLSLAGGVWAAELEPGLESLLSSAPPDSQISVIAKLFNPHDIAALDQELHLQKAPLAYRHQTVIAALKDNAARTQGPVLERLDAWKAKGDVAGFTAYWVENLIVVLGNADAIRGLATDPAVQSIGFNFRAELIEPVPRGPIRGVPPEVLDNEAVATGQRATGALRVNREMNITGHGVLIAGLDTGVDGNHPALQSRWRGVNHPHAECWLDALGTAPNGPVDNYGHGTHTMGTMCGRAFLTNGDTLTVGAAPDAEWIACNAIDQGVGGGFDQDVLNAYQWFTDPDNDPNTMDDVPDVIQNSWGVTSTMPGYSNCFNNWNTAITNCEAAGPVVTWSAGNEGQQGPRTLRSPAKFELSPTDIFSVGAVDVSGMDTIPPHPIANFSSLGPSDCGPNTEAIKPEIVAPGVNVYSCVPIAQGSYGFNSGTSMAGPHIAGVVALMREACPDCDPQTIKETLISTAIRTGYVTPPATENNTFGNGFVDAWAAVNEVYALGRVDGTVTTGGGAPLADVHVEAIGGSRSANTNASGYFNLMVSGAGFYSIRFTKFGYATVVEDSVEVFVGDTSHVNVTMDAVPNGVLQGTVTLQSGYAARGARVSFPNTPLADQIADTNGRFALTMPATDFAVHIEYVINVVPPRGVVLDTVITVNVGDTTHVQFPMFVDMVEPSAADAYGYQVYDRQDRDMPCAFSWAELDPAQGGHGAAFTYVHQDSCTFFRAPFPISFYGQVSESLSVNCNGWMLPGVHHLAGRVDTRIPSDSAGDPPGIIAPFWNDLRMGQGARQFSGYDATTGIWSLEFLSQHLTWPGTYSHNWEVQFLDPALYPNHTGDCEIRFLYGTMGWLTSSTIGIENPAENTGVQARHDETVPTWAWPVEAGSAMRFSTTPATQYGHANVTLTLYPAPANGTPLTVKVGGRTISTTYSSPMSADSVPAAPVSAVLLMTGYENGRVDHVIVQPNGTSTFAITAWRLDPPRNLTGSEANSAVTLQWRRPQSVEIQANPDLRYSVYRDGVRLAQAMIDTVFTDGPLPADSTVHYVVRADYRHGSIAADTLTFTLGGEAVHPIAGGLPTEYALHPCYPNPFNPDTRIRLDLPATTSGRLEIFDLEGRLVKTLYSGALAAGRFEYSWNSTDGAGRHVASGLYFCRFASPHFTATQKMMLVK